MKKFMKICAITVAVILVAGIILMTVGGCGGGFKKLTNQALNGDLSFGPEDLPDWVSDWGDGWVWNEEWDTYDLDVNSMFNNAYPIIKDGESCSETFSAEGIRNLELGLGGCEVTVTTSPDESFHVYAEKITAFQTYTEGDTLYVAGLKNGKWTNNFTMKVEVQIPAGVVFECIDMELGAGDFNVDAIEAGKLDLEIGAGRLQIGTVKTNELKCQLGAGQVVIENAETTGKVSLEVGAGELVFTGSVPGDLDAECALGNMEIHILGSTEADHNFDLECAAGNLTAGSHSYAGLVSEQNIENGAASDYKLNCAMGNMTLTFE
ncbi:MAG: DUF4097 family beta strand repeat-containing protein [Lachnospiraceae bacterium]